MLLFVYKAANFVDSLVFLLLYSKLKLAYVASHFENCDFLFHFAFVE